MDAEPKDAEAIAKLLLPNGELEQGDELLGASLECWMAMNYADTLATDGKVDQAKRALEYATSFAQSATLDFRDLIDRILTKIEQKEKAGRVGEEPW